MLCLQHVRTTLSFVSAVDSFNVERTMKTEERFKDSALSRKSVRKTLLPRLTPARKVEWVNPEALRLSELPPQRRASWSWRTALKKKWKMGVASVFFTAYTAVIRGRTRIIRPASTANAIRAYNLAVIGALSLAFRCWMSSECPHGHQALDGYLLPNLGIGAANPASLS